jgi:hypothetical protein
VVGDSQKNPVIRRIWELTETDQGVVDRGIEVGDGIEGDSIDSHVCCVQRRVENKKRQRQKLREEGAPK